MGVNSYRFITLYLLVGIITGFIAVTSISISDNDIMTKNINITKEIGESTQTLIEQSDNLVKPANTISNTGWGNENGFTRSWVGVFSVPMATYILLPKVPSNTNSIVEDNLSGLLRIIRWILGIFATFEIFQLIWGKKTT